MLHQRSIYQYLQNPPWSEHMLYRTTVNLLCTVHAVTFQVILKCSTTMEKEGSKFLSDDESTVFEILPGKIGKLSGQDVRGMRNKGRQAVWSSFCAKLYRTG